MTRQQQASGRFGIKSHPTLTTTWLGFLLLFSPAPSVRGFLATLTPSPDRSSSGRTPSGPATPATKVEASATSAVATKKDVPTVAASLNQEALALKIFPRTWVPVASVFELDPDRPTSLEFLGQKYVAYLDDSYGARDWVVLDDACPHRLAPLSEGRIERRAVPTAEREMVDGGASGKTPPFVPSSPREKSSNATIKTVLQCSYHGWEFEGSTGRCSRVPQAAPAVERAALASNRSRVASYPTAVEKNVLWMWPWKEDVLSILSKYPRAHPGGFMEGANADPTTYTRDLPYGWDTLVENLIDPAHVPFAHHGMQGSRADAIPINMSMPVSMGEEGFTFTWQDRTMGMLRAGEGRFQAPYTVAYNAVFESETPRDFKLVVLCVPTKPGWSRAIILGPTLRSKGGTKEKDTSPAEEGSNGAIENKLEPKKNSASSSLIRKIFPLIPVWVVHQLNNKFLDSDLAFLHYQERERQRRTTMQHQKGGLNDGGSGGGGGGSYFMPAPSDRCIAALRAWIPKYTDMVDAAHDDGPLLPTLSRSEMFDRWTQHTSHCKHCQEGLKTLKKVRQSAFAALAVAIFGFKYRLAKVTLLLCLGTLRMVSQIESSFREGEFKHYENH